MAGRLRAEFPLLGRLAYLNAGTNGPLAARAAHAATVELVRQSAIDRSAEHFARRRELAESVRRGYASVLGCDPVDVALTTSTSEAIDRVLSGLRLPRGAEIVTSDEEHPGLLGPLQAVRDLRGVRITSVPLDRIVEAVGARTRLIACSHVAWVSGKVVPAELARVDVPVLLDGAQGIGAIPLDVRNEGWDFYAGAGQKWLCGPDATGMLYVSPTMSERLVPTGRSFASFANPEHGIEAALHPDARRHDTSALAAEALACAEVALAVLEQSGWDRIHARARGLADSLAAALRDAGRDVVPRGPSTLVSFASPDPPAEQRRLREHGVVVRVIPERDLIRASVGAWNDDSDLDRLLAALR